MKLAAVLAASTVSPPSSLRSLGTASGCRSATATPRCAPCWSPSTRRWWPSTTPRGATARRCSCTIRWCASRWRPSRRRLSGRPHPAGGEQGRRRDRRPHQRRQGPRRSRRHRLRRPRLEGITPLAPARMDWFKLVGFVPESDLDAVRTAIFAAGAGTIGDYIHCSFTIPGEGTFEPGVRAHPSIGEVGVEQRTGELRLEAVFPRALRRAVTDAFVAAHSYEEPAFDVYPGRRRGADAGSGSHRLSGCAADPREFAGEVAALFGLPAIRFTGDGSRVIEGVAVLPGSGASLIDEAAAAGVGALVTGDIKYHDADRADRLGLALIDVPHEIAEGYALRHWSVQLAEELRRDRVTVTFLEQPRRLWRRLALSGEIEETMNDLGPPAQPRRRPHAAVRRRRRAGQPGTGGHRWLSRQPRGRAPGGVLRHDRGRHQQRGRIPGADRRSRAGPRPQGPQADGALRQRAHLPAAHRALQGQRRQHARLPHPGRPPCWNSSRRSRSSASAAKRTRRPTALSTRLSTPPPGSDAGLRPPRAVVYTTPLRGCSSVG